MATLDKIKSRIHSIQATAKITNAMELVATAKIKKARNNFDKILDYYQIVINNIVDIIKHIPTNNSKLLTHHKGATIWIILTSDLGLCGGYNIANFKKLKKDFQLGDTILAIGSKAKSLVQSSQLNLNQAYFAIISKFSVDDANQIAQDALNLLLAPNSLYTSIKLVATQFINNITFEPEVINIFPIEVKNFTITSLPTRLAPLSFEQSSLEIIKEVSSVFLVYILYAKIQEAKLVEQASRRLAMEAATKNANELIDDLKIQYNQKRQANITQEIAEIIAGSNL